MEIFYVLKSGKYLGAVVGDVVDLEDNPYHNQGCIQVPFAPESSEWYWDFEKEIYYLPALTGQALLASNIAKLHVLMTQQIAQKTALTNRISTIQDAIDIGMVTEDERVEKAARDLQLDAWKRYGVLLGRVTSKEGWYSNVEWPTPPDEAIDLTLSAPLS